MLKALSRICCIVCIVIIIIVLLGCTCTVHMFCHMSRIDRALKFIFQYIVYTVYVT